jgi:hypothetical protein
MFQNNFKIAWRNLLKDRQFTFLFYLYKQCYDTTRRRSGL